MLWIVAVLDGNQFTAYAMFDRNDNPQRGLKRVQLVDFQSLDGTTALLAPRLGWALRRCRAEGIHVLEHTSRWLEPGEFIHAAAPYRRPLPTWWYYYYASNPALAASLSAPAAWAPSLFEGNASICTPPVVAWAGTPPRVVALCPHPEDVSAKVPT